MMNAYELFFRAYVDTFGGILVNGTLHAVELCVVDDEGQSRVGWWGAEYLADKEGIRLFLGPYSSSITRRVARVVHARGGVQVAPGASWSHAFDGMPNVFGTLPAQASYTDSVLDLLGTADHGARKTLWYMFRGNPRNFAAASRNNISVIGQDKLPQDESWRGVLDAAMQRNPDIVMFSNQSCTRFMDHMWRMDYAPKALVLLTCPTGKEFLDSVGRAARFLIHVTAWLPSMPLSGPLTGNWTARSFAEEYHRLYGAVPPYQAASAFAGAAALVRAIEDAGSTEPQAVADALRTMQAGSMYGDISFGQNGQAAVGMKVTQFHMNSRPLLVHPCTVCDAALVYPRPPRSQQDCFDTDEQLSTRYGWLHGRCQECPRGRQSWVETDSNARRQRVCKACAVGRAGSASRTCEDCLQGRFATAAGTSECTACPHGRFAGDSGSTACTACAAGRMAEVLGSKACTDCLAGLYQNATGSSSCTRCGKGKYGARTAATSCDSCLPTFTTDGTGFSHVSACGCRAGAFDVSAWDASRAPQCKSCPEGVRCGGFGEPPELEPGYHESSGSFSPLRGVWRCDAEVACPGGVPGTCAGQLQGIACSSCPEGMSRQGDVGCERCSEWQRSLPWLAFLALVLVLVSLYYGANEPMVKETSVKLGLTITAGVAITVAQLLGALGRLKVPWPPEVLSIIQWCAVLVPDGEVMAVECLGGSRLPWLSYAVPSLGPFAVVAVFGLLFLLSQLFPTLTRNRLAPWSKPHAFNAIFSLAQCCFIALAGTAAIAVQCYTHPNGKSSMVKYPGILCYEPGPHMIIITMGCLMTLLIVIPYTALCFWGSRTVFSHAQRLGVYSPQLEMFRFLTFRYQPMVWWWGSAFHLRQLLLGLTPMIFSDEPGLQLVFVQFVLLTYLMAASSIFPWRSAEINMLDLGSTALLSLVMATAACFLPESQSARIRIAAIIALVLAIVIMLGLANLYGICLLFMRGLHGTYGIPFPPLREVDRFADEWSKQLSRLGQLEREMHRELVHAMTSLERASLDRMMCVISCCMQEAGMSRDSGCVTRARSLLMEPSMKSRTTQVHREVRTARVVRPSHFSQWEESQRGFSSVVTTEEPHCDGQMKPSVEGSESGQGGTTSGPEDEETNRKLPKVIVSL